MPKVRTLKSNFAGGEISPRLERRTNLVIYQTGCRRLRNSIVTVHGGAYKRSGTRHVAAAFSDSTRSRLIAFQFSSLDVYVIELANLTARFFRDGAIIEDPVDTPVEVVTPWAESILRDLVYTQSYDTLFVVHETTPPQQLVRASNVDWTLSPWTFFTETSGRIQQPHHKFWPQSVTLTQSTSGALTLTGSDYVFHPSHEGTRFRFDNKEVVIDDVDTAGGNEEDGWYDLATATAVESLSGAATTTQDWSEQAWSAVRGWPRTCAIHQERLVIGGSRDLPNRMWLSKSGDFFNFDLGDGEDDEAIELDVGGGRADPITWLITSPGGLAVGTLDGEWALQSGLATDQTVTPSQNTMRPISQVGSVLQLALLTQGHVVFVGRDRRRIYGMPYDSGFQELQRPRDLTIYAEHITYASEAGGTGGIVELAWQENPDRILWAIRADGRLLGMTWEPQEEVLAWHQHPATSATDLFESVAVLRTSVRDEPWIVCDRSGSRHIEQFQPKFSVETPAAEAWMVDDALQYDGAPATTISGMDHLEGRTVQVFADGSYEGDFVVTSGGFDLTHPASVVVAGLGYRALVEPTRDDAGGTEGTTHGSKKRLVSVTVDVWRTHAIEIGADETRTRTVNFADWSIMLDDAPELFDSSREAGFAGGWVESPGLVVVQDPPLPMEIRAITRRTSVTG